MNAEVEISGAPNLRRKVMVEISAEVAAAVDDLLEEGSPIRDRIEQLLEQCLEDGLRTIPKEGYWVRQLRWKRDLEPVARRGRP